MNINTAAHYAVQGCSIYRNAEHWVVDGVIKLSIIAQREDDGTVSFVDEMTEEYLILSADDCLAQDWMIIKESETPSSNPPPLPQEA